MGSSSLLEQRQAEDKAAWDAYWKVRDLESRGTFIPRARYYAHKWFDAPATWFRETIVEPLNNKNRLPYYHWKLSRVPEIDECGVNDKACFFEANEQFRLDKMVDGFILQVIEDLEENELNFFIKYGELGGEADVRDAYMKQKHRLIWERRHPEIMEERKRALKEHKEKLARGEFDYSFWKKGMFWQDKKNYEPPYEFHMSKASLEGDKPLSKDWEYYKKVDPPKVLMNFAIGVLVALLLFLPGAEAGYIPSEDADRPINMKVQCESSGQTNRDPVGYVISAIAPAFYLILFLVLNKFGIALPAPAPAPPRPAEPESAQPLISTPNQPSPPAAVMAGIPIPPAALSAPAALPAPPGFPMLTSGEGASAPPLKSTWRILGHFLTPNFSNSHLTSRPTPEILFSYMNLFFSLISLKNIDLLFYLLKNYLFFSDLIRI